MENNLNKERGLNVRTKRFNLGSDITRKEFSDAVGLTREEEKLLKYWEDGSLEIPEKQYKRILEFPVGPSFPAIAKGKELFTFIDLFAGIGGIRLGFHRNGGRPVFSSEFDKFARKTYRINYGEIPSGDITLIDEKTIPDHDILVGGFPCQPFSKGGLKKGFDDTRGTLFFDIARILKEKRPKAFMLENVKQLRGHNNGETLGTMLRILDDLNYYVPTPEVLKSYEFGIPQNRERIIIVGFNRDYITDNSISFEYPEPDKESITSVANILEKNVDGKYTISDKLFQGHIERKERNKANGKGFGASFITAESRYTNTISARYYKDGSEALVLQEDKNPRMLTPRECARLQGFPEEFIIPVSNSQAYKQFGNSVTINVIEAVARQMVKYMKSQKML